MDLSVFRWTWRTKQALRTPLGSSPRRMVNSIYWSTSTCQYRIGPSWDFLSWRIIYYSAGAAGPTAHFSHNSNAPELQSAEKYGKALFDSQSFEDWSKLEDIDIASLFFVTTAFLGLLVASTKNAEGSTASVINITSATTHSYLHHGVVSCFLLLGTILS